MESDNHVPCYLLRVPLLLITCVGFFHHHISTKAVFLMHLKRFCDELLACTELHEVVINVLRLWLVTPNDRGLMMEMLLVVVVVVVGLLVCMIFLPLHEFRRLGIGSKIRSTLMLSRGQSTCTSILRKLHPT